ELAGVKDRFLAGKLGKGVLFGLLGIRGLADLVLGFYKSVHLGAIPTKTSVDPKVAIQDMAEYSQKLHKGISRTRSTKTYDGLAAIQAQLSNLGREIKKANEKVYAP
nr:hypothetical protein [Tanacetum cinerariifolium]